MAKTIDDLILEISDLVKTLNKQNSNPNGKSGHNGFDLTTDIFQSFAGEIRSLAESAKRLSEVQSDFADAIAKKGTQEWQDYREKIINDIKSSATAMEEFKNTIHQKRHRIDKELDDYVDSVAELKLEEASIQDKINAKRIFLQETEQKLINDKLKIEEAELAAKQKYSEEIKKQSEDITKFTEELAEHNEYINRLNDELKRFKLEFNARPEVQEQNKRNARRKNTIEKVRSKFQPEEDAISNREQWGNTLERKWNLKNYHKNGGLTKRAALHGGVINKSIGGMAKKVASVHPAARAAFIAAESVSFGAKAMEKGIKTIQSGKADISGLADGLSNVISKMGPMGKIYASIIQVVKVGYEEFVRIDKAASNYVRSVGGGRAAMVRMRKEAGRVAKEMSKWGKTAYDAEEILNRLAESSSKIGRNLEYLSVDDMRSLVDLKNFGVSDDAIAQMDTFGISVHNTSKQLAELYGESGKRGLNAKATIQAFTSNLKMAQNYTFARGQKALMDMAMKSAQLKFNLRDAEQFANKVSTLEGAMTAGAHLSVLGGSFAMQGNPLAMMYNGLNDVEGLQNQMLAMTKGMARWDSKKGQLDITAFDRERLKAMSQATGIDYSDLTSQALNQARVDRVSKQLNGKAFDKEHEEYIKNIASLDENGNAYVKLDGETHYIDELRNNSTLLAKLKNESERKDTKEGADMGDVWSETRDTKSLMDDYVKFFKGRFVNLLTKWLSKDGNETEEKYSLDEIQRNDLDALKNVFVRGELKEDKFKRQLAKGKISEDTLENLRSAGMIDKDNNIISRDDKFSKNRTYSYNELAHVIASGSLPIEKAYGGFVSGDGGPTEDAIPARLSNGEFVVNAEATTRHRPLLERINNETNNRSKSMVGFNKGGYINTDNNPTEGTISTHLSNNEFTVNSNVITHHLLLLERINHEIDNIYNLIKTKSKIGFNETKFRNSSGLGEDVIRGVNNSGNLMRPETKIGFNKGKIRNSSRLRGNTIPSRLSNGGFEVIERYRPLSERINRNINNGGNLMRPESIIGFNEGKFRNDGRLTRGFAPVTTRLSENEFAVNIEETTRHRPLSERINRGVKNGDNLMRHESIMGLNKGEDRIGGVGNQKIDVSPIKIEFGTLELKIGDLSRVLDSNEVASRLLNNSTFVDNIVKEIGIRSNFGYRKDVSSNKFLDSPFVRSF